MHLPVPRSLPLIFAVLALLAVAAPVLSDDGLPIHSRIDQHVESRAGGPLAAAGSDQEFLRRVYLDLAGRVPSAEETRAYLADAVADKRALLIDRLLASDD